eukprot:gnl/Trimastix_PCT/3496.p1 GENE.gnl/Trimastix_PCT/3496~~gnl/Trimastix_PCT/3496.p1  ORF type:complete len:547 (-),score=68.79 gnl/Trimastix_PCT/3496:196-1836(-)
MSSTQLTGIYEGIRDARHHAAMGQYDESLVYYDGMVAQIKHYLLSADPLAKERWNRIKTELCQEADLIKQITHSLAHFKAPRRSPAHQQPSAPSAFASEPEHDPDVWRPPTPLAPVVVQPPRRPRRQSGRFNRVESNDRHERVGSWGGAGPSGGGAGRRQSGNFGSGYGNVGASGTPEPAPERPAKPRRKPPVPRFNQGGAHADRSDKPAGSKRGGGGNSHDETPVPSRFTEGDREIIDTLEREIIDRNINVDWEQIAGLQTAKDALFEAATLPFIIPNYFTGLRRPWRGVLLFGPPGTGKTLLAKAVATQCNTTFFNVHLSTVTSKWRGDSEKMISTLFKMARFYAPSVIFIDEVDALMSSRGGGSEHEASRRVKSEILTQMDGVDTEPGEGEERKVVVVLAATNYPWDLDEALRRRFEKRVYIPLPDQSSREELLGINMQSLAMDESVQMNALAQKMEGYSGADITNVCRDASMMKMRRRIRALSKTQLKGLRSGAGASCLSAEELDEPVSMQDFLDALAMRSPSVSQNDIERHERWMGEFGST